MKKILVAVAILGLLFLAVNDSDARGIGIKGGYALPQDDYEDAEYDDTPFFGLYFDAGTFLFDSLRFKPGVDYMQMESDIAPDFDVIAIHIDWYWYFLGNATIKPFLGFGPTLNYYDAQEGDAEDSDGGLEGFVGFDFNLSGPFALTLEARYLWHDIATMDHNVWKLGAGIQYNF